MGMPGSHLLDSVKDSLLGQIEKTPGLASPHPMPWLFRKVGVLNFIRQAWPNQNFTLSQCFALKQVALFLFATPNFSCFTSPDNWFEIKVFMLSIRSQ